MINVRFNHPDVAFPSIQEATSDCGRVRYIPWINDGVIIEGRDVWRGIYLDPKTKMVTEERVAADVWEAACALFKDVGDHNRKMAAAAQDADFARQEARAAKELESLNQVGWH